MSSTSPPRLSRRRLVLLGVLLAVLGGADWARPADRQVSTRILLTGVHLYQRTLSHAMPALGIQCRFRPTCSHYADVVIARHGAVVGSWMTFRRVLRCGPWTPMGTVDQPR
jgi:uncharacterized protein